MIFFYFMFYFLCFFGEEEVLIYSKKIHNRANARNKLHQRMDRSELIAALFCVKSNKRADGTKGKWKVREPPKPVEAFCNRNAIAD